MGKADKKQAQGDVTKERDRSLGESNKGITDTQGRVDTLMPRSDAEREAIRGNYSNQANTGFITDADRARLSGASVASGGGGGGEGGGGGGGSSSSGGSGNPSYIDVFNSMTGASGGWDPTRQALVEGDATSLRNARQNYGDINKSITGLQDYAKIGGVSPEDLARINRPLFEEFEKTGGYSEEDKANIRSRSNSSIANTYGSLKENLNRQRAISGNVGPGLSAANFKLARQGAQDIGTNTRDTEIGIGDTVRAGRMDAAKTMAANQLALQPIKNAATLGGYGKAGDLGNTRESQIQNAIEAAAGIDTNMQNSMTQARLGAAGGLMQDALGRASIGASSGAASAALNAANERFLIGERNQYQNQGNEGLLNLYKSGPQELEFNQDLLRGYRSDASGQQQGLNNQRIQAGQMPGMMDSILKGVNAATGIAGMGAGIFGGFGQDERTQRQAAPYMGNTGYEGP